MNHSLNPSPKQQLSNDSLATLTESSELFGRFLNVRKQKSANVIQI